MQLTCCVDGLSKVTALVGVDITDLLPSGCTAPVCNNTLGGGAACPDHCHASGHCDVTVASTGCCPVETVM